MAELVIRKGIAADRPGIFAVQEKSFARPGTPEMLKKDMIENRASTYIVAELAGRIVGFISVWSIYEECQINLIAVDPFLRGQKIGTALLQTALHATEHAGLKLWTLEVRESNIAARRLYTAAGFTEVGKRHGYYTDPIEDALLMNRILSE